MPNNRPKTGYSLGFVEDWAKHGGKGADKATILEHLANIQEVLEQLQKRNRELASRIDQSEDQKITDWIMESDKPTDSNVKVKVSIEPHTDNNDVLQHFVHITHEDGSENEPARAFQDGKEIYIEMWPIPKPYVFTLNELKGMVAALESAKDTLPQDTPDDDSLGAV